MSSSPPKTSLTPLQTVDGSHSYTVNGFSLSKGFGIGRYISSDTFTVGGYEWAIYFYPEGKDTEGNSDYVSVFVVLVSEALDVRALFKLSLLDQSGKGKNKFHNVFDRALEMGPCILKYRGSMWGYTRYFKRDSLEISDYLKDDRLKFTCTVGVVVDDSVRERD